MQITCPIQLRHLLWSSHPVHRCHRHPQNPYHRRPRVPQLPHHFACLNMAPIYSFPNPMPRVMSLFISLCTNVSIYVSQNHSSHALTNSEATPFQIASVLRCTNPTMSVVGKPPLSKPAWREYAICSKGLF